MTKSFPVQRIPVAVRGYTIFEDKPQKKKTDKQKTNEFQPKEFFDEFENAKKQPSEYILVFDTETTVNAAQNLTIGTYQVYEGLRLIEKGIFYDPKTLREYDPNGLTVIINYCERQNQNVKSKSERLKKPIEIPEFIENVFYKYAYDLRGTVVGFNLAFDISRLAIGHDRLKDGSSLYRGGFTLKLSESREARMHIRHISSKLSFFQFGDEKSNHAKHKKGRRKPIRRGFFIDLKTLAAALTSKAHTLKSLAITLDTKSKKSHVDGYGLPLTNADIDYALNDTQVTYECYLKLIELYQKHQREAPPYCIYSEASLGKTYLKDMGIQPWQKLQPDFSPERIGIIMSSYFGGRAEVHIRRKIEQVMYCDFLSMYPTVCTLMNLWEFITANGIDEKDVAAEIRDKLNKVKAEDLLQPDYWNGLQVLVQIIPDGDILPVRAQYGHDDIFTIGVNKLTYGEPLWYTLADCIASKLLSGKTPNIVQAISFIPRGKQEKLKPVKIFGNPDYCVNPKEMSFFKRLIDLRTEIKTAKKSPDWDRQQQALKILANATSYGIFVELIDTKITEKSEIHCYGHEGKLFSDFNNCYEDQGSYFHPLLATLITGAARLLLAMAEKFGQQEGLDWVFCDTDSMAFAKPKKQKSKQMENAEFYQKVENICHKFKELSPYAGKPALFKIEDENFKNDGNKLIKGEKWPLFCFAVSAKRYALFNKDENNKIKIRKVSAHGLGHLRDPYLSNQDISLPAGINEPEEDAETSQLEIDEEREKDETSKVKPWHKDFWRCIVDAALNGDIDSPNYNHVDGLTKHAASMFSASTPEHLNWFKAYNGSRDYFYQVKPFNFMLIFKEKPFKGERKGHKKHFPIATYDRDLSIAAHNCFDRETGEPISSHELATYFEDRGNYHQHPETKFNEDTYGFRGAMQRKHVCPTPTMMHPLSVLVIGKEANALEERLIRGNKPEDQKIYTQDARGIKTRQAFLGAVIDDDNVGFARFSETTKLLDPRGKGLSENSIRKIYGGDPTHIKRIQKRTLDLLDKTIEYLSVRLKRDDAEDLADEKLRHYARGKMRLLGSTEYAFRLGYNDPSDLSKRLNGDRNLSDNLREKLRKDLADQLDK